MEAVRPKLSSAAERRVIAYDITRLFVGPLFVTPRGVDRVDLALARYIFDDPGTPNLGVLPTPWGVRAYPATIVKRLLNKLQILWSEHETPELDLQFRALLGRVCQPDCIADSSSIPTKLTRAQQIQRILELLRATTFKLGRPVRSAVPHGAVYLNVGQLGLAIPIFHKWLDSRPDVTSALMLHDVIPLEYPHLVSKAAVAHHHRMVATAARHADCLIFNSAHARDRVNEALKDHDSHELPSLVRWLPLPPAFHDVQTSPAALAGIDYFVVVSTIEPRKNHELLIRVWQRLLEREGENAPHLIIVGSPGYRSAAVLAQLASQPTLKSRIHVVSGLSSPALASLVLGATGMLSPSLVEGFGLPVLEANALGVPTLASDIAAHREIGGPTTKLLPTGDAALWEEAILALGNAPMRSRPTLAEHLTEFSYYADLLAFVEGVANTKA